MDIRIAPDTAAAREEVWLRKLHVFAILWEQDGILVETDADPLPAEDSPLVRRVSAVLARCLGIYFQARPTGDDKGATSVLATGGDYDVEMERAVYLAVPGRGRGGRGSRGQARWHRYSPPPARSMPRFGEAPLVVRDHGILELPKRETEKRGAVECCHCKIHCPKKDE